MLGCLWFGVVCLVVFRLVVIVWCFCMCIGWLGLVVLVGSLFCDVWVLFRVFICCIGGIVLWCCWLLLLLG